MQRLFFSWNYKLIQAPNKTSSQIILLIFCNKRIYISLQIISSEFCTLDPKTYNRGLSRHFHTVSLEQITSTKLRHTWAICASPCPNNLQLVFQAVTSVSKLFQALRQIRNGSKCRRTSRCFDRTQKNYERL